MNSRIVTEGVKFALQKEWGFNPLLRKSSKWFNWLAASDPKTCAVCRGYYGQIRGSLDDWPVLPPVHFNCRCFIDYTDAIAIGTATINGTDGADWHLLMNGTLPDYYISTADAKKLGWNGEDNLHVVANGKQIGGDRFYDYGKKLPFAVGRIWYEADINYKQGVRNKHRIVYSNDGLVFVTYDLYETFFEIVGVAGNKKANPQTGDSARYLTLQDAVDDYGGEASLPDVAKKAREIGGDSTGGGTSGTGGNKGPNPNTDDSEEYVYWSDAYNVNYRTKPVVGNGGKVYYYTQYYSFITGWKYLDMYDYNPQQTSQSKKPGEEYVTASQLISLGWSGVTSSMVSELNRILEKYDITTTERIRHFLAQCMQETNKGAWLREGEQVNWSSQQAYEDYYNKTKYKYKYRGSGYIQLTWDYGYQAFATFMIKQTYPDLNQNWRSPNNTDAKLLNDIYNDAVKEAIDKGYNIDMYIKIYTEGADYVAKEFAWEAAGYDWHAKGLNVVVDKLNPGDKNEVDKVTAIINLHTSPQSYSNRRDYYEETLSIIR